MNEKHMVWGLTLSEHADISHCYFASSVSQTQSTEVAYPYFSHFSYEEIKACSEELRSWLGGLRLDFLTDVPRSPRRCV